MAISDATALVGALGSGGGGAAYLFTPCLGPCSSADLAEPFCTFDIDDIDAFVAAFLAGDLSVDCDANGTLNLDDIDCFVSAFLAGCP